MKYNVGDVVKGTVTGFTNYGIFVSLDGGYTGLIHISELSSGFVKNVSDYAKIGNEIESKIIEIEEESEHIKLSLKEITEKNSKNIVETKSGFSTLKQKLPIWIEENLKKQKNI